MAIDPIYPKPNLSKCLQRAAVVPYLLRNADITRSNQAWSIDITYIPMKHGFLYLTAIIDWHSRCIVGWELDDTLDTRACIEACKRRSAWLGRRYLCYDKKGVASQSLEHRRRLKWTIEVYHTPNIDANIMLFSYRNIGKRFCMAR